MWLRKFACIALFTTSFLWLTSCTSVFYQPDRNLYAKPEQLKVDYEPVVFKSLDGTALTGWFLKAKGQDQGQKPKGLILQYHGNAQNLSSHFVSTAWLTRFGYDVFIFDYRGYGTSYGSPDPDGVYQDGIAALKWAHKKYKEKSYPLFAVIGQSLGGNVALKSLEDFPERNAVDFLVLDSTFLSYEELAFDVLTRSYLTYIFSPLAYPLVSDEYSPVSFVEKLKTPTLVIHGKKDHVIPPKFGEEIYKKLKMKKKWFWLLPEGKHIAVFFQYKKTHRGKLLKILDEIEREKRLEVQKL